MYKISAKRYKDPRVESRAGQNMSFFFSLFLSSFFFVFFLFLFLFSFFVCVYVYFNVVRVLSVPTSGNTGIFSRFPTINYRILTHMGSKDRFNFRANSNSLFKTSAKPQNCTSRVPLLFLALFLASESRCGATNSTYQIFSVINLA